MIDRNVKNMVSTQLCIRISDNLHSIEFTSLLICKYYKHISMSLCKLMVISKIIKLLIKMNRIILLVEFRDCLQKRDGNYHI